MATVSFNKITPIKAIEDKTIELNGEKILIKQYLPVSRKAMLVSEVLADVLDEHGMSSSIREKIYTGIRLIQFYTNINITDTMINNAGKTYDALVLNGILPAIIENIPKDEYEYLAETISESLKIVSTYRTSIAGLFTDMQTSNQDSVKSSNELMAELQEISNDGLLKNILDKMG